MPQAANPVTRHHWQSDELPTAKVSPATDRGNEFIRQDWVRLWVNRVIDENNAAHRLREVCRTSGRTGGRPRYRSGGSQYSSNGLGRFGKSESDSSSTSSETSAQSPTKQSPTKQSPPSSHRRPRLSRRGPIATTRAHRPTRTHRLRPPTKTPPRTKTAPTRTAPTPRPLRTPQPHKPHPLEPHPLEPRTKTPARSTTPPRRRTSPAMFRMRAPAPRSTRLRRTGPQRNPRRAPRTTTPRQ